MDSDALGQSLVGMFWIQQWIFVYYEIRTFIGQLSDYNFIKHKRDPWW